MAARVKTDAADSIVNRRIVSVCPIHLQRVAVGDTGRVVVGRFLIAHPERIGWIKIENLVIFDENLWNAIVGRGQQKALIKTNLKRTGIQLPVPIGPLPFFA